MADDNGAETALTEEPKGEGRRGRKHRPYPATSLKEALALIDMIERRG